MDSALTPQQKMLIAMKGGQADCIPVAPDISNMIPCRLTRKPFWDIYLYQDPPCWKAYIDAVRYFGFDGWLPAVPVEFDYEKVSDEGVRWQEAIVCRTPEYICTRFHTAIVGKEQWSNYCNVYYIDNPPTHNLPLSKVGLSQEAPSDWKDVSPRTNFQGVDAYYKACEYMGDTGVVGLGLGLPGLGLNPESMYEYYDNRDKVIERCQREHEKIVRRAQEIVKLKPDLLFIGISGFMISNPEHIFRELSLLTLKEVTAICKRAGIISQIHCCGPEYSLVKIAAEESNLDSINPLEIPPMGDCNLAEIKKTFGKKLSLMGNLHTTEVMLRGSVADVERASKKAIDDAGEGGGFILSTGDQCGRDTPDENIFKMIEVAKTYGKYL